MNPIIAKYGMQIMSSLVVLLIIASGILYIKHQGALEERDKWEKRDAETARQSEDLLKLKQHEKDQADKQNQERYNNAIEIYAKHYDDLRRAADAAPKRLFISAKTTSCGGDTVSGAVKNKSGNGQGSQRITKTELPESNLRQLNSVISRIELMQLQCERLLNTVN